MADTEDDKSAIEKASEQKVLDALSAFTPGMSEYDKMLAAQGYGIDGPPVDYNMPGGSKGTGYSLLAGQPYANYDPRFFATPGGIGSPDIPNIPGDAGVITTDTPTEEIIPDYPRIPIIDGMPINYTRQELFDMFGNVLTDREFKGDSDSSGSSRYSQDGKADGGIGKLWENIRNPDVNMRGQPMDPAYKDFNVRDRMFDNPQGPNLVGNIITALTPFSAVPGLNDMISKAVGGGIGALVALGKKIPVIGDAIVKPISDFMGKAGEFLNPKFGEGSSSIPSMIKNLTEYSADAVAPNRPGYLMRKTNEAGEKTHGLKTLLNRMADKTAEGRPNIFMREYDEDTGKLTGDNIVQKILGLPGQGIDALRDKMSINKKEVSDEMLKDNSWRGAENPESKETFTFRGDEDDKKYALQKEEFSKNVGAQIDRMILEEIERTNKIREQGFDRLDSFRDDPSGLNTGLMGGRSQDPFAGGKSPSGSKRFGGLSPAFNSMVFDLIGGAVDKAQDPFLLALQEATKRGMTVPEYAAFLKDKANKENMANGGLMYLSNGGYPRMNGQISGPGTERSDDIPAMLSDGEFVTNAAALRGIGQMAGAPKNNKEEQRRLGAREMYKLQRKGMNASGAV